MGATLDRSAGDPQELGDLPGRALAEVRELEDRALTCGRCAIASLGSLEEIAHLRVLLGSRLIGRFRDPRLRRQLPCFDGPMTEEIDREAASAEQDPRVERPSNGIERRHRHARS